MDNTIIIQFDKTIIGGVQESINSFVIRYNEPEYVHGPTVSKVLGIKNISVLTTDKQNDTVKLTTTAEFNNASGNITVEYDASAGCLFGSGGYVDSFIKHFMPTNLDAKLSPNAIERFDIVQTLSIAQIPMEQKAYESLSDLFVCTGIPSISIVPLVQEGYDKHTNKFNITAQPTIVIENISSVVP